MCLDEVRQLVVKRVLQRVDRGLCVMNLNLLCIDRLFVVRANGVEGINRGGDLCLNRIIERNIFCCYKFIDASTIGNVLSMIRVEHAGNVVFEIAGGIM